MVDIELDGVWCDKCKCTHPEIFYHDKYDYRDSAEGVRASLKRIIDKRPGLIGLDPTDDQKYELLNEMTIRNLKYLPVYDAEEDECVVCGYRTKFKSKATGHHVCSPECREKDANGL